MFFFCVFPCLHITHNVCVCLCVRIGSGSMAVVIYWLCWWKRSRGSPSWFPNVERSISGCSPVHLFFHLQGQGDPWPSTLKRGGKLGASDLLGMLNKKNRHPPISMATKRRLMSCVNTGELGSRWRLKDIRS